MKFYISVVVTGLALILGINLVFDFSLNIATQTFLFIAYSCLPSALILVLVRLTPKKFYSFRNPLFHVFKFENKIYEFFKIRRWKNKIPELGSLANFKKDKIYNPKDKEYIKQFIVETCYAEATHSISMIWGFLCLAFIPAQYRLIIGFPIATINGFLHFLPSIIQRYMRPRLMHLLKRLPP